MGVKETCILSGFLVQDQSSKSKTNLRESCGEMVEIQPRGHVIASLPGPVRMNSYQIILRIPDFQGKTLTAFQSLSTSVRRRN